jgi:hypothetical protein
MSHPERSRKAASPWGKDKAIIRSEFLTGLKKLKIFDMLK